jgi:hypothetical protein
MIKMANDNTRLDVEPKLDHVAVRLAFDGGPAAPD